MNSVNRVLKVTGSEEMHIHKSIETNLLFIYWVTCSTFTINTDKGNYN